MPYAVYNHGKHKFFYSLEIAKLEKQMFGGILSIHNGYYWTIMEEK